MYTSVCLFPNLWWAPYITHIFRSYFHNKHMHILLLYLSEENIKMFMYISRGIYFSERALVLNKRWMFITTVGLHVGISLYFDVYIECLGHTRAELFLCALLKEPISTTKIPIPFICFFPFSISFIFSYISWFCCILELLKWGKKGKF